jgi:SAM-dependent methyltransferase
MNAEHLDFPDASFDTVCIANSLHHLSDFPQVLAEMMRVLKPSGDFVVEEMYQDGQQSDAQHTDMLEHHWIAKIERMQGLTHHETLRRNQIVTGLESLHFSKLEVLDSSRYVKCLFCSQRFVCEDPKSNSTIEFFIKGIDTTLQGLKPSERLHELFVEAERIKERVKETGVADASLIFAVGSK